MAIDEPFAGHGTVTSLAPSFVVCSQVSTGLHSLRLKPKAARPFLIDAKHQPTTAAMPVVSATSATASLS